MKKSLCLFLSAILLLCGCGKIETEPVINDFEVDKYIDEAEYIEEEKNDARIVLVILHKNPLKIAEKT